MIRTRMFPLLIVALAAVAPCPTTGVAQAGGLIKKAREAVKPPKQDESAETMNDIYADPEVVPITEDQLVRFEKALKYEVSERAVVRKEQAKGPSKTPEEFQACSDATAISADAQKLGVDMSAKLASKANAPPEEAVKVMEQFQADFAALVVKRCGENPAEWQRKHDERLRQRLDEIPGEASDIAMPEGWIPRRSGDPGPAGQFGTSGPAAVADDASEDWIGAGQQPHPFLRAYAKLKERITPYCVALDLGVIKLSTGTVGTGVGIKVPGWGAFFVYSNAEAKAMEPKCPSLLTWLKQLP